MPTTDSIDAVLKVISSGKGEYGPMELVTELKAAGIEESDAKEAISYLISDHQLEMTEDRRLKALELVA